MKRVARQLGLSAAAFLMLFSEATPSAASDTAALDRLIRQLGSDRFAEREEASKALRAREAASLPALWKATRSDDPEIRRRAREIVVVVELRVRRRLLDTIQKLGGSYGEYGDTVNVGLARTDTTDAVVSDLRYLRGIRTLALHKTLITNAALEHIKEVDDPDYLDISSTKITDAGLIHLKGLRNLRRLDLSGTRVTDAGLVHLLALEKLEELDISYTAISDAGLVHVKAIKKLTSVNLAFMPKVTDKAIADLLKAKPPLHIAGRKLP